MREIKFRSKRYISTDNNGEWIYGDFHDVPLRYGHRATIYVESEDEDEKDEGWVEIDRHSLGTFTGLKDKEGKDIYEGDIIQYTQALFNTREENFPTKVKEVKWLSHTGAWNVYETNAGEFNIKVIGNIHENSELL